MTDKDLCKNCAFKNKCEKYRKCLVLQEKLEISVKECRQLKELLKEAKDIIEWYKADCGYIDTPTEAILTKIDNAIGEKK